MKMSTKGRYGLRVMVELATHFGAGPVQVETISRNQMISGKYIHVLVGSLKTAGLIRAVRGPSGGYALTRKPSLITAFDIISALEGRIAAVECVADPCVCSRAQKCAVRDLWSEVSNAMNFILSGTSLEQLASKQRAKNEETLMYHI
jgi:Rrf2 family protein